MKYSTITQSEYRTYRELPLSEAHKYQWEEAVIVTDEDPNKTIGQYYTHHGGCGNDYKYSRTMINREHKLWRQQTIDEFYGNCVVD